jgi:hypothetical protein
MTYIAKCIAGWWDIYWHTDESVSAVLRWRP